MISPVSFTSTYKVNNQNPNNPVRFNVFKNYADKIAKSSSLANTVYKKEMIERSYISKSEQKTEETLIVPETEDKNVEDFCQTNGIKFEKLYTHDLLDSKKIKYRIQEAPRGYKKVDVDCEKLERLIQNQLSNINGLKRDYKDYYLSSSRTMLLEGNDFPATTLRITPVEDRNRQQIIFDFVKSKDNLDCYTYFALRNIGLENIPVYVDDLTYKIGSDLELFS